MTRRNIYVPSERAGYRAMASVSHYLETHLRLAVNTFKSAVDRSRRQRFLGYSVSWHKQVRLRIASRGLQAFMAKLRPLLR